MTARDGTVQHADQQARRLRSELASSLLVARVDAGLSQAAAARAAGMSHAQWGRIERGVLEDVSFGQACRACAAVGLKFYAKTVPDGDPARDAGQRSVLERFRLRLQPEAGWATEVVFPIPGDRRAWDGMATLHGRRAGCEAETHPRDTQALERRLALKLRDGGVDILLLIVPDTRGNRRLLEAHREVLRSLLPLDTRQVLAALSRGELPERSGLVVI
jgi:transcriptional regulator with XRE-family HTH domain